jgi:hypothetical protein
MLHCFVADYSPDDLADILSELKVLIHVGEHENVLRILGACTKGKILKFTNGIKMITTVTEQF